MTLRSLSRIAGVSLVVALTALTSGCKKDKPPADSQEPQARAEAEVDAQQEAQDQATADANAAAEVEAKLAAADAVDGEVDKVVSKCPACALGMDGSGDHAFETAGYTLHFCSAGCKEHFSEDVTKAILALKIPQE